jgi:hypothetical protein
MMVYLRECWANNRMFFWKWILELYIAVWATIIGILELMK